MTRAELHNVTGFHPASLIAAAAYLRANFPRNKHSGDATAIIKNEGHMNGVLDTIELLIAAASPQAPETTKKEFRAYSQPQTENQNKP